MKFENQQKYDRRSTKNLTLKKTDFQPRKNENNSTLKIYYKSRLEALKRKSLAFYVFHKREIEL